MMFVTVARTGNGMLASNTEEVVVQDNYGHVAGYVLFAAR